MPNINEMRLLNDSFAGLSDTLLKRRQMAEETRRETTRNALALQMQKERQGFESGEGALDREARQKESEANRDLTKTHYGNMLTESQERTALDRDRLDLASRQQSVERMHWARTQAADTTRLELLKSSAGDDNLYRTLKWLNDGVSGRAIDAKQANDILRQTGKQLPPDQIKAVQGNPVISALLSGQDIFTNPPLARSMMGTVTTADPATGDRVTMPVDLDEGERQAAAIREAKKGGSGAVTLKDLIEQDRQLAELQAQGAKRARISDKNEAVEVGPIRDWLLTSDKPIEQLRASIQRQIENLKGQQGTPQGTGGKPDDMVAPGTILQRYKDGSVWEAEIRNGKPVPVRMVTPPSSTAPAAK